MTARWRIVNIIGTAGNKCGCGTWKRHWENETGLRWPSYCGIHGCRNDAEVGAHIRLDDGRTGNYWYILPMCRACNGKKKNLRGARIDKGRCLAWARRSATCDTYFW